MGGTGRLPGRALLAAGLVPKSSELRSKGWENWRGGRIKILKRHVESLNQSTCCGGGGDVPEMLVTAGGEGPRKEGYYE